MDKAKNLDKKKQGESSALHRLYVRQQPKVRANKRNAALLKTFADDDYKKIAQLIKAWLG